MCGRVVARLENWQVPGSTRSIFRDNPAARVYSYATFYSGRSARKQNRLQRRRQIIQPMQHDRQPGRVGAIAQIAEQEADGKHLAEEEPVILQVQDRPAD